MELFQKHSSTRQNKHHNYLQQLWLFLLARRRGLFYNSCLAFLAITALAAGARAQQAWINEFHYDNDGVDTGEFVEVVAAKDGNLQLERLALHLYNGSDGTVYRSATGDQLTPGDTSKLFALYSWNPSSLQNGNDGIAVSYNDSLLDFISYEGAFTATEGPANGYESREVGLKESSTAPEGQSLQLTGSGGQALDFRWVGPTTASPGSLNADQTLTALSLPVFPAPTSAYVGDTVTVTYRVGTSEMPAQNLVGLGFQMRYDPALLQLVETVPGDFFSSDTLVFSRVDSAKGKIAYSVSKESPARGNNGTGSLVAFRFHMQARPAQNTTYRPNPYDLMATEESGAQVAVVPRQSPLLLSAGSPVELSDSVIAFGKTDISQPKTVSFVVTNKGRSQLSVPKTTTSSSVFAADPSAFSLASGDSQIVDVSFAPTNGAAVSGRLLLYTDSSGQTDTLSVSLSGQGVAYVWPGDTDNSGTVTVQDLLPIGQFFDLSGPPHDPRFSWEAIETAPWKPLKASYADATGDGLISQNDLQPIGLNYNASRSSTGKKGQAVGDTLLIQPQPVGTKATVFIEAPPSTPVKDLLGVAVELSFPGGLFQITNLTPSSWFNDGNLLSFKRINHQTGTAAAAYTRTQKAPPLNGSGPFVQLNLEVVEPMKSAAHLHLIQAATSTARRINNNPVLTLSTSRAVALPSGPTVPEKFHISSNYPNPFNSQTILLLDLPEPAAVQLTVYNALGQQVLHLVQKRLPAGFQHQLRIKGSQLSSGVYFYHLTAQMPSRTQHASGGFTVLE